MKNGFVLLITIFLLSIGFVFAIQHNSIPADVDPSRNNVQIVISEHAVEVSPGVFSIGTSIDPSTGKVVEGYAIVDYKKENARPPWAGGGGGNQENKCYSFLAKDAKWKTQEDYLVDLSNNANLSSASIRSIIADSISEWEFHVYDIFGSEVVGIVNRTSIGNSANGKNEVIFADVSSNGVIAVTYVWGIFYGSPNGRYLAEWDQVYDDADYGWNIDGSLNDMDFENIAQHELGHSFGLGHPDSSCTEETMYAYADYGETKKRDLNSGDIAGIKKLYA